MEEDQITIKGVPLKVASWGGYSPSKLENKVKEKPKRLILFLPGNPGVVEFYYEFLSKLYDELKTPIWIVSHGGHYRPADKSAKVPSLKTNTDLYVLEGQVTQKVEIIKKYLDGVEITFMGHSIGCKMIMDVLRNQDQIKVDRCYFFFPTLERMAITRNGEKLMFALNNYLIMLAILGSALFCIFPLFFQVFLIKIYNLVVGIDSHNEEAIRKLIHPAILSNVFFLAENEMKVVVNLDEHFINKYKDKLFIYYGASDDWTPLFMYEELKEKFHDIDARVCSNGFKHAFVLNSSLPFASYITQIYREHHAN